MRFYFIAGEPSSFITLANMAHLIKMIGPNHINEAIVPYHDLLARMDVQDFLDQYDRVWHLPSCGFQKNILRGYCRGRAFMNAVTDIPFHDRAVVFVFISMELDLNLLIKHINDNHRSIKIVLLSYTSGIFDPVEAGGRLSNSMTVINRAYSLLLGCYPMKSYIAENGYLMFRKFSQELPFTRMVLLPYESADETLHASSSEDVIRLPYPSVLRSVMRKRISQSIVVFFGDATIADFYVQLDRNILKNRTYQYVKSIRDYYGSRNIEVYYKPHPVDGQKVMTGCESLGLPLFQERINAEMLYSKYYGNIVAVYTVSSHSVLFASKNGIPAYWAYEYCFDNEELKKAFRKVTCDNHSPLLRSISNLDHIGSIDDRKVEIDMQKVLAKWKTALQQITCAV